MRKRLVIYGNGSSKFRSKLQERLAKHVLHNVDLVTCRDEETFAYYNSLASRKSHIFMTADPAFLLRPADFEVLQSVLHKEKIKQNGGLLIGITCGYQHLLISSWDKRNHSYRREVIRSVANLVDRLIEEFHATIIFLPHCIDTYHDKDDRRLAEEIYQEAREKHRIIVVKNEYSARELKGVIGTFDLFIGGRLHSAIAAMSLGIPTIVVRRPKDSRVHNIIGGTMNQQRWIYTIKTPLDLEGLFVKIKKLVSIRHEVSSDLTCQTKIVKEKALLNGRLLKAVLVQTGN